MSTAKVGFPLEDTEASRTLTAGRFINEKEVGGFKIKVLLNEANFQKFIQNAMREHYNGFNQEDFQEESPASHCMFFQDFADVAAMIWARFATLDGSVVAYVHDSDTAIDKESFDLVYTEEANLQESKLESTVIPTLLVIILKTASKSDFVGYTNANNEHLAHVKTTSFAVCLRQVPEIMSSSQQLKSKTKTLPTKSFFIESAYPVLEYKHIGPANVYFQVDFEEMSILKLDEDQANPLKKSMTARKKQSKTLPVKVANEYETEELQNFAKKLAKESIEPAVESFSDESSQSEVTSLSSSGQSETTVL